MASLFRSFWIIYCYTQVHQDKKQKICSSLYFLRVVSYNDIAQERKMQSK